MKKHILLLWALVPTLLQAQVSPVYQEINTTENGVKVFVASDYISFLPGFEFKATTSDNLHAYIYKGTQDYALPSYSGHKDPFTTPINKNLHIGTLPGYVDVSALGATSYNIPITVVPGRSGIQPNLSIAYNSLGGEGDLGIKWHLTGISQIYRDTPNLFFNETLDGIKYSASDKLAIDGNRLIKKSDGTYRTYNENYSKIIEISTDNYGPTSFKVIAKDGTEIEYGNTNDSKIKRDPSNSNSTIIAWRINKITDPFGNYMIYNYKTFVGQNVIDEINYTGNGNDPTFASVKFSYQKRDDYRYAKDFDSNNANISRQNHLLLSTIEVSNQNELVRTYLFKYVKDKSKLGFNTKLNEIILKSNDGKEINSTLIGWGNQSDMSENIQTYASLGYTDENDVNPWNRHYLTADVNGDGHADILKSTSLRLLNSSNYSFHLYLYNSGSFEYKGVTDAYFGKLYDGGPFSQYDTEKGYQSIPFDFNKDFKTDLLDVKAYNYKNGDDEETQFTIKKVESSGDNYSNPTTLITSNVAGLNSRYSLLNGDFTGDGTQDVLFMTKQSTTISFGAGSWKSLDMNLLNREDDGYNFKFYTARFNDNNKVDIIEINPWGLNVWEWNESAGQFSILYASQYFYSDQHDIYPTDLNGDGLTDLVLTYWSGSQFNPILRENYYLSNGDDFQNFWQADGVNMTLAEKNSQRRYYLDMNGDGIAERVSVDKNSGDINVKSMLGYCFYKDGSFSQSYPQYNSDDCSEITVNIPTNGRALELSNIQFADFTGDGNMEIIYFGAPATQSQPRHDLQIVYLNESDDKFDYVTKIRNGDGIKTYIEQYKLGDFQSYETTDNSTIVVKPSNFYEGTTPPLMLPRLIATLSANNENISTLQYKFRNAIFDPDGAGLLGFIEFETLDNINEFKTTLFTEYNDPKKTVSQTWLETKLIENDELISGTTTYFDDLLINNPDQVAIVANEIRKRNYLTGEYSEIKNSYDSGTGNLLSSRTSSPFSEKTYTYKTTTGWLPHSVESISTRYYLSGKEVTDQTDYQYTLSQNKVSQVVQTNREVVQTTNINSYGLVTNSTISSPGLPSKTTSYVYDNDTQRFVVLKTNSEGNTSQYLYNGSFGTIETVTFALGLTMNYSYDSFGIKTQETDFFGKSTYYSNDWATNGPQGSFMVNRIYGDGIPEQLTYVNAKGQTIRTETESFGKSHFYKDDDYNINGSLFSTTNTYNANSNNVVTTTFGYDEYNRITSIHPSTLTQPITTAYDNTWTVLKKTTSNPNISGLPDKTITYDLEGNISKVDRNDQTVLSFKNYNSFNQPKEIIAEGATTAMTYNDFGEQISLDDPNIAPVNYSYNAYGQLAQQIDAKGNSFSLTYDALGRLIEKTNDNNPSDKITNSFNSSGNGIGQSASVVSGNGSGITYDSYDEFGRLLQLTESSDDGSQFSSSYTYYDDGKIETMTYPNGYIVKHIYDHLGNIIEVLGGKNLSNLASVWQMGIINEHNQITTYSYGNGLNVEEKFDDYGFPEHFHTANSNAFETSYVFDHITGNLNSRTHVVNGISQTESFTYDLYDRLDDVSYSGNVMLDMEYFNNGNIKDKSDVGEYSYDNLPHVVDVIDPIDGQTLPIATQQLSYTTFDKTETVTEGNNRVTFFYGPNNFRVRAKFEQKDGSDQWQLQKTTYYAMGYEETQDATGTVIEKRCYISTPTGVSAIYVEENSGNGQLHYIHQDYLGSITAITDENGLLEQSLSYDAWGRRRNPTNWQSYDLTGNEPLFDRGYTGHEHINQVGLINMNGRMYDPLLGQMLSPDNYVQNPTNSQSYNRYSYVLNNPLKYTDPSGEIAFLGAAAIVYGVFFTDKGYDLQKYVSPVAVKIDIDLPGGGSQGVGIKTSVGVPQIAPVHARVHGGIGYYKYDEHLGGSERSGLQTTYGFEAGFNIAGASQVTYGQTFYNAPGDKFDQRTGHFVVGNPFLNIKMENDFFGDKGDKYRSGAGEINVLGFGVGFGLFTGDPGSGPDNIGPDGPEGTYIKGPNSNPDEYRAGGFYFKTPFGRLGKNSEKSRNLVQNLIIHKNITSSPYFKNLGDANDYFYYQSGSGIGFLY
jgi:RHS repeat-associated protein